MIHVKQEPGDQTSNLKLKFNLLSRLHEPDFLMCEQAQQIVMMDWAP